MVSILLTLIPYVPLGRFVNTLLKLQVCPLSIEYKYAIVRLLSLTVIEPSFNPQSDGFTKVDEAMIGALASERKKVAAAYGVREMPDVGGQSLPTNPSSVGWPNVALLWGGVLFG